jgi:hypothetical protein
MASKALLKAITSPGRVASLLEKSKGGRPLLALEIQRHRIGMAVIWSPLGYEEDVEWLPDIPLSLRDTPFNNNNKTPASSSSSSSRRIPQESLRELASTIQSHDVCGLIVGWPVQKDTGRMGAPCGRVLYTLESILDASERCPMLSSHRPLCFWTPQTALLVASASPPEDEWGRCASYGEASSKALHLASKEQYAFDKTAQATDLWEDFWMTHWPELYKRSKLKTNSGSLSTSSYGNNLVSDWRDTPAACLTSQVAI